MDSDGPSDRSQNNMAHPLPPPTAIAIEVPLEGHSAAHFTEHTDVSTPPPPPLHQLERHSSMGYIATSKGERMVGEGVRESHHLSAFPSMRGEEWGGTPGEERGQAPPRRASTKDQQRMRRSGFLGQGQVAGALESYLLKWTAMHHTDPGPPLPAPSRTVLVWSFIASFIGIAILASMSFYMKELKRENLTAIIGSFGASAVLVFASIDSPLAQPRNLVFGNTLSAIVGVSCRKLFNALDDPYAWEWSFCALAVALSISVMQLTRTTHPPGGATSLIAVIGGPQIYDMGYVYVLMPVLAGSVILLLVALLVNNIQRSYPKYWLHPHVRSMVDVEEMMLDEP